MDKTYIYFAFLIAVSVAIVTPARADVMLEFTDGTKHVWENIQLRNGEVCTALSYGGTYCCRRADVVRSYPVPAGTQATDFGLNFGSVVIDEKASAYNQRSYDDSAAQIRQRDAEIARMQKENAKRQHRNKIDGKSEWAQ